MKICPRCEQIRIVFAYPSANCIKCQGELDMAYLRRKELKRVSGGFWRDAGLGVEQWVVPR